MKISIRLVAAGALLAAGLPLTASAQTVTVTTGSAADNVSVFAGRTGDTYNVNTGDGPDFVHGGEERTLQRDCGLTTVVARRRLATSREQCGAPPTVAS